MNPDHKHDKLCIHPFCQIERARKDESERERVRESQRESERVSEKTRPFLSKQIYLPIGIIPWDDWSCIGLSIMQSLMRKIRTFDIDTCRRCHYSGIGCPRARGHNINSAPTLSQSLGNVHSPQAYPANEPLKCVVNWGQLSRTCFLHRRHRMLLEQLASSRKWCMSAIQPHTRLAQLYLASLRPWDVHWAQSHRFMLRVWFVILYLSDSIHVYDSLSTFKLDLFHLSGGLPIATLQYDDLYAPLARNVRYFVRW